eukprot:gene6267-2895_t
MSNKLSLPSKPCSSATHARATRATRPFSGPGTSRAHARGIPTHATSNRSTSNSSNDASTLLSEIRGAWGMAQVAALAGVLMVTDLSMPPHAAALLSSPNAQVSRTVDAALRRSIPAFNPELKNAQKSLEDITYLLRIPQRKPWGSMANDVKKALAIAANEEAVLAGVPADKLDEARALSKELYSRLKKLELAVASQQSDYISVRTADSLKTISDLELIEAPGLAFDLPKQYRDRTRLIGRAVVELKVERQDGSLAFSDPVAGGLTSTGIVQLTLDGYSAPLSAGNFVANVMDGLYNEARINSTFNSMLVPGKVGQPRPPLPLENLPLGEFEPVYRLPLDVQGGELPVLPLSISGAVSMGHIPGSDAFLSGEEWFIFKFDKQQAGLAGLAFDEGTFGVFGYVTQGMDVVTKLSPNDIIISGEVISDPPPFMRPIGLLARSRAPSWSRISGRPVMTLASPPAAPHHVITGPAGMEAPAQGTWTVRRYSTDTDSLDKSQVLEICAKVYDGSDYMPRMLDSYAADPHVLLLVAETLDEGGKPMLGGIIGADRRGEVAFVFGLRVREETRGQGVGKLLMSQLYLSVPSALPASPPISKIITVTVEINKPAMAIISNHMTGPLHRVDSFPGRDALEMYQNHIGWCDENTNPTTLSTMLDVVPGKHRRRGPRNDPRDPEEG